MLKPVVVAVSVLALSASAFVALRDGATAQATSGGDPYRVRGAVDVNPDPTVFETFLVAKEATVDVGGGVMAKAFTFNGAIPAPELRVKTGDTVIVHFENQLPEGTGIHWHGIELNNTSDGTPLTQNAVPPGGSYLYRYKVPRAGIFWYHPHGHAATNQVFRGMYGSLIAADPHEPAVVAAGVLPGPEATRTMVLSDTTVCKEPGSNDERTYDPSLPWIGDAPLPAQPGPTPADLCERPIDNDGNPILDGAGNPVALPAGAIPNVQPLDPSDRINEGQTVLTNGRNVGGRGGRPEAPGALDANAATLDVAPGQGLRMQLINAATWRYFRLRMTTSTGVQVPLVRVGGEGGLLDAAVVEGGTSQGFDTRFGVGEIVIAPGDRADVVASIPADVSGVATMWTMDFFRTGLGFTNVPTVPVLHADVTGPPAGYTIGEGTPVLNAVGASVPVLAAPTGALFDPATFALPKVGTPNPNIRFTTTNGVFSIDRILGIHDATEYTTTPHQGSSRYARLGDVIEMSVTNTTGTNHPFHLHGFSFQPLSFTDPPAPEYIFPYREFVDEIDIPPFKTLNFRVLLEDRPLMDGTTPGGGLGRWVFHCHIFVHNVGGMTSELVVLRDGSGNEKPNINASAGRVRGRPGQIATVTGTYHDLDGEALNLTASVGTIVDHGNGTWTWSWVPDGVHHSQTVFVTATDSAGNQGQHGFVLAVDPRRPTEGDFDANGTADIGVYRPSSGTWFVNGVTTEWGVAGDIPVPADYDGDGDTDIAVFRPTDGTWYVQGGPAVQFGMSGDIPVPADYDGDGDTDRAVFRPSTGVWFVEGGATVQFGAPDDVPVRGDYDGDGDADIAVFRPSTGVWFVNGGPVLPFGAPGDIPLSARPSGL